MNQFFNNYNKTVIFDLDGVLINSRDIHFEALNRALSHINERYVISKEEHLAKFDGLSTSKKLQILHETRGLPLHDFTKIWERKQKETLTVLRKTVYPSKELIEIFDYLNANGFMIAVASNAVNETVKLSLECLGLINKVKYHTGNDNLIKPKPYPEIYWRCMNVCHSIPKTTLIVEDSHIGRQAAVDSGAFLLPVENPADLTLAKVKIALRQLDTEKTNIPWRDSKLNVLIPMAGAGSRFAQAGYTFPKPLIEIHGKPMIQQVVENLNIKANYIFIVQKEHYEKYNLKYLLNLIAPNCKIVVLEGITDGAARTVLLAKDIINNDNPLLIANSDQWIEWNSNECMYAFTADQIDGGILTFEASHPKWSYAKTDEHGFVSEVAEKKVISTHATVGVYYWNKGSDFVASAEQMIAKDIRTNNEFYVAPAFNEAILDGKKIRVKQITRMWGLGDPESLELFLKEK